VISAVTNDDVPDPAPDDDAVYRAHASELIAYATVLVGRDDARDVVTDAVLSAFASREWPTVRNRRAYLYRPYLTGRRRITAAWLVGNGANGVRPCVSCAYGALVGEFVNEGNRIGPMVAAVPDTPAARLLDGRTPDELGIPKPIGDCEVCPAAYAVSDDGQTIAWMDGAKLAARSLWDPDAGVTRIETGVGAVVDTDVVADGTFLLATTTEATGVPAPRHVAVDASLITEFLGATFLDS